MFFFCSSGWSRYDEDGDDEGSGGVLFFVQDDGVNMIKMMTENDLLEINVL